MGKRLGQVVLRSAMLQSRYSERRCHRVVLEDGFHIRFLFFLLSKLHTQRFWIMETHKVPGSMIYTEPPLHLFVMLFPVQYMEKRFLLETR